MSTSKLAVVATPIGNLADLAPRAAEALKSADLVLCEDTRHSKPLLDRLASQARLVSCHQHNERERAAEVIVALREGKRVALISDAGAPGVSDPGSRLIEDVVAAGCAVEVFPGPSALTAALMGAGIDVSRFVFLGFLPRSGGGRSELLAFAARSNLGVVIYEAPHRVADTLTDLAQAFAARRVVVARELTKLHETFHRGTLGGALSPPFVDKGEAVILIEAAHDAVPRDDIGQAIDVDAVAADTSLPPKERAKQIAKALQIPVKDAYERVQRASMQSEDRLARAAALLAETARAFVDADLAERRTRNLAADQAQPARISSEIPGADALLELLAHGPSLRAPVEAAAAARALLGALEAMDMLDDALAMEAESRSARSKT